MPRKSRTPLLELLKVAVSVLTALLILLIVLQVDSLEDRLINLSNKLDTLDRHTRDLQSPAPVTGKSPRDKSSDQADGTRKFLHPELPNYLSPDPFRMRSPRSRSGGTLTRWFGSDPKGLNFLIENGSDVSEFVRAYVSESLADYHFKDPGKFAPRLAVRVEVTDDYREYTVYLRKHVFWHTPAVDLSNPRYSWLSGQHEFTAEDVRFTVDLILNPQVEASHLRNYYQDLEYCKVIDRYTVVFRWKKKTYNSIDFTLGFRPVPKFLYSRDEDGEAFAPETLGLRFNEHWYNQKAIGTGPYRFVSYEQGVAIKLERNDAYWGEKPAIDKLHWLIFPDRNTNRLKFKSGELDYARFYPPDYREEIVGSGPDSPFRDGRINHDFFIQAGYYYIGWNLTRPVFADRRVRRALTMCCNRKAFIEKTLMGLGVEVTGPFFCKSPYNDPSIKPLPYSPEKARRLLSGAGWEDHDGDGILDKKIKGKKVDFEFTLLLYTGSPEWRALATQFKETLAGVGIKMSAVEVEWSLMQKRMQDSDFDAYSGGWGASWDPDPYQIWHSSQASIPKSSNRIGFKNKEADKIIEALRNTFDKKKRLKLAHMFHRIIHEEQPYTFVYSRKRVLVWWDRLKRVVFAPVRPQDVSLPWYLDLSAK